MKAPWKLYRDYQMGSQLLADVIRSGVARGLYTKALGDRMVKELVQLEPQLQKEAQAS